MSRISHDTSQVEDMSRITMTDRGEVGDTDDLEEILDDGEVR